MNTEKEKPHHLPDIAYQIYTAQFTLISTLSLAAAGGALLMYQVGLYKVKPWTPVIAAILFAISALIAVMGPMELARGATEGKDVRKTIRWIVAISLFFFGTGTGAIVIGLIRNAMA